MYVYGNTVSCIPLQIVFIPVEHSSNHIIEKFYICLIAFYENLFRVGAAYSFFVFKVSTFIVSSPNSEDLEYIALESIYILLDKGAIISLPSSVSRQVNGHINI